MPRPPMPRPPSRPALRTLHLILSVAVGTFLYSPLRDSALAEALVLWVAYPALAAAGLWMWQQGRIAQLFRPRPAA